MNTLKYIFIVYFVLLFVDLKGASDPDSPGLEFERTKSLSQRVGSIHQPWRSQHFESALTPIDISKVAAVIGQSRDREVEQESADAAQIGGGEESQGRLAVGGASRKPSRGEKGEAGGSSGIRRSGALSEASPLRLQVSFPDSDTLGGEASGFPGRQERSASDAPPLRHSSPGGAKGSFADHSKLLAKPRGRSSTSPARPSPGTSKGMYGLLSPSSVELLDGLSDATFEKILHPFSSKAPKKRWLVRIFSRRR